MTMHESEKECKQATGDTHSAGGATNATGMIDNTGRNAMGRDAAERLAFFSDAVVAIAITLLAIDLPVPTGDSTPEFLAALRADPLDYLAFLISFVQPTAVRFGIYAFAQALLLALFGLMIARLTRRAMFVEDTPAS